MTVGHDQQRMRRWVGPGAEIIDRTGRNFMIVGYLLLGFCVLVALPGMLAGSRDELGQLTTGEVVGVAAGVAVGCGLVGGGPWLYGYSWRVQSRQELILDGAELTVGGGMSGPRGLFPHGVFDLTRAPLAVELVGGTRPKGMLGFRRGHRRPLTQQEWARFVIRERRGQCIGSARLPYHPVLLLQRDDGWLVPVELCDVTSRQMRDQREILQLARVMDGSHLERVRRAAGQLRTVARWARLPLITAAEPDAVPSTPADYPLGDPPLRTPVRSGDHEPEILRYA